ncbi:ATP synthase F0 subunit B [Desulfocurvus sp.]|jgi:F-type H+-transporting ATPase subunit b|uniref:ATP synthase F0 subunit B n=1 Tax=Desulfocurvus sp. TaxID=2871698 RepID=UPI0025BC0719|nr:ATP synthase F0 subunit B [Desulfocurvus sp.]MCK9240176.1 ATP synthase F0 subunit B [Desulfocurvus sp.]
MIDLNYTFFVQFVNFIITLFVLNYLLVSPIREVIRKRKAVMGGLLGDTEKFVEQAETKLANYRKALDATRVAGAEQRASLKAQGAEQEKEILSVAGQQAAETLKAERAAVEGEVQAAKSGLQGRIDALADKAIAKVLG